ncbi:hypothetical protein [Lysobacter gummosus]|uniref:hypothetical protein n=1 Tax=Lysobacter gummosus TaxID=262324 RepID=UPI003CCD1BC3
MAVSRKKSLGPEGPATRVLRNRRQKQRTRTLRPASRNIWRQSSLRPSSLIWPPILRIGHDRCVTDFAHSYIHLRRRRRLLASRTLHNRRIADS